MTGGPVALPGGLPFFVRPATGRTGIALVLLHGIAGEAQQFVADTADALAPGAVAVSVQGMEFEGEVRRHFRRHGIGQLDLDDLAAKTARLTATLQLARLLADDRALILVGFGNGANLAASMLLTGPAMVDAALLFCPMLPFAITGNPPVRDLPVFIGAGLTDPIATPDGVRKLEQALVTGGARVHTTWAPSGHGLHPEMMAAATPWLATTSHGRRSPADQDPTGRGEQPTVAEPDTRGDRTGTHPREDLGKSDA